VTITRRICDDEHLGNVPNAERMPFSPIRYSEIESRSTFGPTAWEHGVPRLINAPPQTLRLFAPGWILNAIERSSSSEEAGRIDPDLVSASEFLPAN